MCTRTVRTRRRAEGTTSPCTVARARRPPRKERSRHVRARGMTLLEIGIALAIVAGLVAIAVPSISNIARVQLAAEGERARSGAREATREEELLATVAQRGANVSDEERTRAELARKSAFTPTNDIPKTELGGQVRFAGVWVSHQPERYVSGKAFLYFWPSGLTETASIQLAQGDDANTSLVEPLTGKVRIASGAVNAEGQK